MMEIRFKGPRQKRALEALLSNPEGISCRDLGSKIGSLNPRQTIMELRRLNFKGLIITRRFAVKDRDGRDCLPGEYVIPIEYLKDVGVALSQKVAEATIATPTTLNSLLDGSTGGHKNVRK